MDNLLIRLFAVLQMLLGGLVSLFAITWFTDRIQYGTAIIWAEPILLLLPMLTLVSGLLCFINSYHYWISFLMLSFMYLGMFSSIIVGIFIHQRIESAGILFPLFLLIPPTVTLIYALRIDYEEEFGINALRRRMWLYVSVMLGAIYFFAFCCIFKCFDITTFFP